MDAIENRILSACLSLPESIVITSISSTKPHLVIQAACQNPTAACPLCEHFSERIHDRYVRTVADVPCCRSQNSAGNFCIIKRAGQRISVPF